MINQPVLVLRLAAAAAVLGTAGEKLDVDIAESLSSLLADAGTPAELVDGLLGLVTRATGLDAAYLTSIDWTNKQQTVVGVHGPCGLGVGDTLLVDRARRPTSTATPAGSAGRHTYISVPGPRPLGRRWWAPCARPARRRARSTAASWPPWRCWPGCSATS